MSPIIVPCEACGTEGRIEHFTHYDRDGNECGWSEPCPYCDGTGGEEIEGHPVDLEDAEFLAQAAVYKTARFYCGACMRWHIMPIDPMLCWDEDHSPPAPAERFDDGIEEKR
jgi:hypothetical protein